MNDRWCCRQPNRVRAVRGRLVDDRHV